MLTMQRPTVEALGDEQDTRHQVIDALFQKFTNTVDLASFEAISWPLAQI